MPISLSFLATAVMAAAAQTGTAPLTPARALPVKTEQPAWHAVHSDTLGDLLFTTETLNGRVRFAARGLKSAVPVTTSDFPTDSVRMWVGSATKLISAPSPKQGEMSGLGQALTINVTTTGSGEMVYGFYVGDVTTDQQLALALTKPNALKLTAGVNSALDTIAH